MRYYFAVYTGDYDLVMSILNNRAENDFAASYQDDKQIPFLVITESEELAEQLGKLPHTNKMSKDDALIFIHKNNVDHYLIIGNENMVREDGVWRIGNPYGVVPDSLHVLNLSLFAYN